ELRPGGDGPRLPAPVTAAVTAGVGEPTRASDTCHVDVADRWGNLVSATPSGGWLWSSPVVPELGFPLGTRAQMFWLEEGLPNSLAPRKRPRTTLTPTIVATDEGDVIGCGSPGGDAQDQWTLQFLLRHLGKRAPLAEAVAAPTFNSLHMPISFW